MKTEIKEKITATNQKYLKKFLTEETPAKLESQLEHMDWSYLDMIHNKQQQRGTFSPLAAMEISEIEANKDKYLATGLDAVKNGKVGAILLDRLLCGDVGFGKTEVALRAAFKCVADSKQCALLCPTTILAWQHYQTVCKRFEGYPIRIELLSRFRTAKQQKETIEKLKRGEVDLVVGTHRLVQKDVEFRDLGLAIIDEEQRFGVAQKERFKELCKNVDVLTLSATPIPRTLNMAMSGLRDMSVIEEAPRNRQPVQTYVLEHDDAVINEAIRKELRRGGQVF